MDKLGQGSNIWKALNNNQRKEFSKTFATHKKDKIYSALSTPRTLELKTKKTAHYWNQLEEFIRVQSHEQTIEDPHYKKQTEIMAENHHQRRVQLQSELKDNVIREIIKQSLQRKQSAIKLERDEQNPKDPFERQEQINNFVKRQEFKAQETLILRQMREFLQFGAIRR